MAPRKVSRRIVLELGSSYSDRLRNSPQRGGDGRSYPAERGEEDSFATSFFWRESPTVSLVEIRLLLEALPEPSRSIAGTRSYRTAGRGIARAPLERHRSDGENSTGSTNRL